MDGSNPTSLQMRRLAMALAFMLFSAGATQAAGILLLAPRGDAPGDSFGASVRGGGDFNNDGWPDFTVGAPLANPGGRRQSGRVYVFFGGPGVDDAADLTLDGVEPDERFGASIAMGDVNGDGIAGLIVGAPRNAPGSRRPGAVYVFSGGAPADGRADLVIESAQPGDGFGISVACPGDVNADGFGDLVVGATPLSTGSPPFGRVYAFFGGPVAVLRGSGGTIDLFGAADGDRFGAAVGTVGDHDGDGQAELIVGAPGNDDAGPGAGRAYVYDLSIQPAAVGPGRASSAAGLVAWPSPVWAGTPLTIALVAPGSASGEIARDLEVGMFDVRGRWVAALPGPGAGRPAGAARTDGMIIERRAPGGAAVAPGVYFVRAVAPSAGFAAARKIVVTREGPSSSRQIPSLRRAPPLIAFRAAARRGSA
jgi:hypothetical protein